MNDALQPLAAALAPLVAEILQQQGPQVVTLRQAAEMTSYSVESLRNFVALGKLTNVSADSWVRVRVEELRRLGG